MLINAKTLTGYALSCVDGEMGHVKDFYFDDRHWAIRYLVADSGSWLPGRQVLISPHALQDVNTKQKQVTVDLTKKQIEDSPSLDLDKPVSRQFEENYYGYFGWAPYWGGPYMWGYSPFIFRSRDENRETVPEANRWDPDLQSTNDVRGHKIEAADGDLGHVQDFIIDDVTWAIRYLLIDTGHFWAGKKVLISPRWIDGISWADSRVYVNIPRETIKAAPEYTGDDAITREYETALHDYYGRQGYWVEQPAAKANVF